MSAPHDDEGSGHVTNAPSPSAAPVKKSGVRGWMRRFALHPLTRLVLGALFVLAPFFAAQLILKIVSVRDLVVSNLPDVSARQTIIALYLTIVVVAGCFAFVHWIEQRRVSELRGPRALPEFALGLALGLLLISTVIGILWALGAYRITGQNSWTVTVVPLSGMILAGFLEEIVFRGLLFRILEQWLGTWIALLISAVLFGAGHVFNPNATLASTLAILLEAGLLLGAAFLVTRRLWLCIGIHIAWNFAEGGLFSVAVSGLSSAGLFQADLTGPVWMTGGEFGVEASVIAVVVCTAAGLVLLGCAIRMGRILRPVWRRPPPVLGEAAAVRSAVSS